MFDPSRILYEDNHIIVVNKLSGELVQSDTTGDAALEDTVKEYIRNRDSKPGNVFLGVVHRIDRPVSGAVLFAKTGKSLARLNEMIKNGEIKKTYWAVTEEIPSPEQGSLVNFILRDGKANKSRVYAKPVKESKEARLNYRLLASGRDYHLVEVELLTGRHHQIRAQLSHTGVHIKGDLKYGARRSNRDGSISLHSRNIVFTHPVNKDGGEKTVNVTAPVPQNDNLWRHFEEALR